jgi:hypothetical protein
MTEVSRIRNEQIEAWFNAQHKSREFYRNSTLISDAERNRQMAKISAKIAGARSLLEDIYNVQMVFDTIGSRDKWSVLTPELEDLIEDYLMEMAMDAEGEE